jgi:putative ABC transport system permease protein
LFAALRVLPLLGRVFTDDEDQPGRDAVVVLGFTAWQQRFGADTAIAGRQVVIDGARAP